MPLPHKNSEYTIDDIYALPDGQRAELIDGQLYMMAPQSRTHQRIVGELFTVINQYIKKKTAPAKQKKTGFLFMTLKPKTPGTTHFLIPSKPVSMTIYRSTFLHLIFESFYSQKTEKGL